MTHRPATVWVGPARLDDRLDARTFKPWVVTGTDACRNYRGSKMRLGSEKIQAFLSRGIGGAKAEPSSVAVFKAKEVTGYGLAEPERFISSIDDCPRKKILQDRDVLLTSSGIGTIGRADTHHSESLSFAAASADNHVTIIRTVTQNLVPEYLTALLNSKYGKAWSENYGVFPIGDAMKDYNSFLSSLIPAVS